MEIIIACGEILVMPIVFVIIVDFLKGLRFLYRQSVISRRFEPKVRMSHIIIEQIKCYYHKC